MLQPTLGRPGHWTNTNWHPGAPGTFAVVIGVSRYWHLAGGSDAIPDRGQPWIREAQNLLGQLHVSALTAVRFFNWLRSGYAYKSSPIAHCWLLLAPTEEERPIIEAETDALANAVEPTFAACEAAIREWADAIAQLTAASQHASRALFFFSGHGLEVITENQLLLPSDYLGGPAPHWDMALSTLNLRHGLDHLQLPHRFYFVDACRNDFPEIRQMQPKGRSILPPYPAVQTYRGVRAAAVLYATTSSLQAWQPIDPSEGPSLFGMALLDGLQGKPDIELRPGNGLFTVNFSKLEGFVSNRVVELLRERHAAVEQAVQPSGIVRDEVVAELAPPEVLLVRPVTGQPPRRSADGEMSLTDARAAGVRGTDTERVLRNAYTVSRTVPPSITTKEWAGDFAEGHKLFGHEFATEFFSRVQVAALDRKQWLDQNRFRLCVVDRAEAHSDDGFAMPRYRLVVSIDDDDRRGHWLQVQGADVGYGVILPQGGGPGTRFILHVELSERYPWPVQRVEASLAEDNGDPFLGAAARIWTRYRTADVTQAVSEFEGSELETLVGYEQASSLAATVAALILLRADRLDLLRDWLRNLANLFGHLPDGAVLWAEHLLRDPARAADDATTEAVEYLGLLEERGLPLTSEAFSYAVSLTSRLAPEVQRMGNGVRSRFDRVQQRLSSALRFYRPGGLFTSYAHFDPTTGPTASSASLPTRPTDAPAPPFAHSKIGIELSADSVDIGGVRIARRSE